jgi:DNA polymerase III subunit beta
MIIPARALNELARIANDGMGMVSMIVPAGRGQVVFRLDSAELVSQLIDGNFPDYKVILPRSFKSHTSSRPPPSSRPAAG